jgi:hypothetical protein
MGSYDCCETCIMLVFWCLLPDRLMMFASSWWTGGVNFVLMSCYEMLSYYDDLV